MFLEERGRNDALEERTLTGCWSVGDVSALCGESSPGIEGIH